MGFANRKYSSIDMIRMSKFAQENPSLTSMTILIEYNKLYPEKSSKEKYNNIMKAIFTNTEKEYCKCKIPKGNYPEMVWCDNCGKEIQELNKHKDYGK